MKPILAFVGACLVTVASPLAFVSAQTDAPLITDAPVNGDAPVNADGTYVVANDDGAPIASGAGQDIVYGDINTGGGGGEVLGDPNAVYSPARPDHPGRDGGMIVMPGAGDGMIGGIPVIAIIQPTGLRPIGVQPGGTPPMAPDDTATTTTSTDSTAGTTSEGAPVESTSAAPPPETTGTTSTDAGFCASYTNWYDAQVAYENLGATAADPALVQEVDPDMDGIACEGMMA